MKYRCWSLMTIFLLMLSLSMPGWSQYSLPEGADSGSGSGGNNEILVNFSFFYNADLADLSVTRKRYDLLYQAMVGYKYNYWIFGLSFDADTEENKYTDTSGDTDYKFERQAWGPTVGLTIGSFYLHLTYFIDPILKNSITGSTAYEYSGGSGLGLTAGYIYRIIPNFAIGAQLAYRTFQYGKSTTNGVTTSLANKYQRAMLDPMFTTMIFF